MGGYDARPGVPPRPAAHPGAARPASSEVIYPILLGLLLLASLVFGAPLLLVGIQSERNEREFPAPVVLSYSEFLKQKPKRGWFRITGAGLSVAEASWVESRRSRGSVSNIHIPVRGVSEDVEKERIHLLYTEADASIRKTVDKMAEIQNGSGDEALAE